MSVPDKILMRKIKKREKKKLNFLQKKEIENAENGEFLIHLLDACL